MADRGDNNYDVIVIGGGPSGAILGSLLAMNGHRALILERDIHPRDHVGESITPSTNPIFKQIGFLSKIEDAGFVHKPGACWTAPRSAPGKFVSLRLGEFPPPNAPQLFTYNVERDWFDTMLIRHAHELAPRWCRARTSRPCCSTRAGPWVSGSSSATIGPRRSARRSWSTPQAGAA